MRLQCPRANAGNLREDAELDRVGQVTAKPAHGAHQVGRQWAGEIRGMRDAVIRAVSGDRTKS
jgi:hypothetical protein